MREEVDLSLELFGDKYVNKADYERKILELAPVKEITELKRRLSLCALQDVCVNNFDGIHSRFEDFNRRLNGDFSTIAFVETKLFDLDAKVKLEFLPK